jgi:hypothetical protein
MVSLDNLAIASCLELFAEFGAGRELLRNQPPHYQNFFLLPIGTHFNCASQPFCLHPRAVTEWLALRRVGFCSLVSVLYAWENLSVQKHLSRPKIAQPSVLTLKL